jgi:hypothetical protein
MNPICLISFGAVAQLGERCVRNAEVGGSSPLRSTLEISRRALRLPLKCASACRRQIEYGDSGPVAKQLMKSPVEPRFEDENTPPLQSSKNRMTTSSQFFVLSNKSTPIAISHTIGSSFRNNLSIPTIAVGLFRFFASVRPEDRQKPDYRLRNSDSDRLGKSIR